MKENLPSRPNLDHLRHQAKALVAALRDGDAKSAQTIIDHLPGARGMSLEEALAAPIRLADAQSALARKYGFESWPRLGQHVDLLRALEGEWSFLTLEIGGQAVSASMFANSRILIDGDRFRTESPEADYEGEFSIDVDVLPHDIDIQFVAGPEAGNTNHGIFMLDGDSLTICLEMSGAARPISFSSEGSPMIALETLTRVSSKRPAGVHGGVAPPCRPPANVIDQEEFELCESPLMTWLGGAWAPLEVVLDGKPLPKEFLLHGQRSMVENELTVTFGGQEMVRAKIRLDESTDPVCIDYFNLEAKTVSHGILQRIGEELLTNMSAPGEARPSDFTSDAGSFRTLSRWKKKIAK